MINTTQKPSEPLEGTQFLRRPHVGWFWWLKALHSHSFPLLPRLCRRAQAGHKVRVPAPGHSLQCALMLCLHLYFSFHILLTVHTHRLITQASAPNPAPPLIQLRGPPFLESLPSLPLVTPTQHLGPPTLQGPSLVQSNQDRFSLL